jgi:DNA-binding MarR family transcriptional regulator
VGQILISLRLYRDTIFLQEETLPKLPNETQLLAQFRYEIRRFLLFSEQAATAAGLQPQQHQLLLQIAGAADGTLVTLSHLAHVLGLRHHTVVELSKRCELAGLVRRTHDLRDRRCVVLELTDQGQAALDQLSEAHARQLRELAPSLIEALTRIGNTKKTAASRSAHSDEGRHT